MVTGKTSDLEQRVLTYILQKKLVSPGEKLVVAVSGGPDSVCLLHILSRLSRELGIDLHIAHLNHQLRGKDSEADAKYVAGLAKRLSLPATIASGDVKVYRKQQLIEILTEKRKDIYDELRGA